MSRRLLTVENTVEQLAKTFKSYCLLLLLVLLAAPAFATKWECGERSNLPMEGKNYCAAGDFRKAEIYQEKELVKLRKKYKVAFGDASALASAQSEFEADRDKQCLAENQRIEDKPYHPMVVAQCKTRLTNLRIDELKLMLQNFSE